jgi:hypothetical protein
LENDEEFGVGIYLICRESGDVSIQGGTTSPAQFSGPGRTVLPFSPVWDYRYLSVSNDPGTNGVFHFELPMHDRAIAAPTLQLRQVYSNDAPAFTNGQTLYFPPIRLDLMEQIKEPGDAW